MDCVVETDFTDVAPEILQETRRRRYTKAVDVWSLGVVLYICLCGFPPFSDELCTPENPYTLVQQIKMGRFDYPSPYWDSVDDLARDLIDRMLTVDVEKRITVDECLEDPWLTEKYPSVTDSTDELTVALGKLDFPKGRIERERTMLSSVNDVLFSEHVEDGSASVKVFHKNEVGKRVHNRPPKEPVLRTGETTASNESSWMRALLSIGYSPLEVDGLVSEKEHDSPWIFFTPSNIPSTEIQTAQHIPRCSHRCCLSNQSGTIRGSDVLATLTESKAVYNEDVIERIEELCGLAGITPSTRAIKDWAGSSKFREGNTVASCHLFRDQISSVLCQICSAVSLLQTNGLCCDSFTILKICPFDPSIQTPFIEVVPVNFRLIENLKQAVLAVGDAEHDDMVFAASKAILQLVIPQMAELATLNDIRSPFAYCALAAQFVSLGLLSYVQAHVGPLQPFFLDTPVHNITLLGLPGETIFPYLEAKLLGLTCLGNMTRGPVLAFDANPGPLEDSLLDRPRNQQVAASYDVLGRAEDILDTWGPGNLVFLEDTAGPPVAIKIGDGFIYADNTSGKFHWARELKDSAQTRAIDLSRSLLIGTLVVPNAECQLSEADCRMVSAGALEYLGASRSSWNRSQRQIAFQGGQYIVGQATETWNKQKGIPVKDVALSNLQHGLIQYLDEYWGLQVSYCTGVARRVPLRKLVADLISQFSNDPRLQLELEQRLRNEPMGLSAFSNWLEGLEAKPRAQILDTIQRVLLSLRHTGLDATEKYFCIAWPWGGDTSRCIQVPLEGWSSWARMLADSHDCATFAYITMECLETSDIRCRRNAPRTAYQNNIHLLETTVTCPTRVSQAWSLKDGEVYFFSKLDSMFWVKVQREQAAKAASLVELAAVMSIPHDMRRRLHMSERKKQRARLRERSTSLVEGEMVFVFSMRKKSITHISIPAPVG